MGCWGTRDRDAGGSWDEDAGGLGMGMRVLGDGGAGGPQWTQIPRRCSQFPAARLPVATCPSRSPRAGVCAGSARALLRGSACLKFCALSSGIAKEHRILAGLWSPVFEAAEPVPGEQAASLPRLL